MSEFDRVKMLHEALDAKGHKEEARNVLRCIRRLLTVHFPEPLHRAFDKYESAYGDLEAQVRVSATARIDGERVGGGGAGDPTGRQAMHMARLDKVDQDLRALYEEHLPALSAPPARRRVRVWRASEEAADAYSAQTIVEIREEYSA